MPHQFSHRKRYEVVVSGALTEESLAAMRAGTMLPGDTKRCKPCQVSIIDQDINSNLSLLDITLEESKPQQIERMLEMIGCKFVSLKRTAFGPINLKGLRKGQWREMTQSEIFNLKKSCKLVEKQEGLIEAPFISVDIKERVGERETSTEPFKSRKILKGEAWEKKNNGIQDVKTVEEISKAKGEDTLKTPEQKVLDKLRAKNIANRKRSTQDVISKDDSGRTFSGRAGNANEGARRR